VSTELIIAQDITARRSPTVAIALGGGAARGLAHIPMLEALDELGIRPRVVAGTSIGALLGACYCAGMTGREMREYALRLFEARSELLKRFFGQKEFSLGALFKLSKPALVDPEALFAVTLPSQLPDTFAELAVPLKVVATDFHAQSEVVLSTGPLRAAISASSSLPGLTSPVSLDGKVLIDGGFVNPTPFDLIRRDADITIAVDVTGKVERDSGRMPRTAETWIGGAQIMLHSLVTEKLKHQAPDIFIRPNIVSFGVLDFYKAPAIMDAAEPGKDELKRALEQVFLQA